MCIYSGDMCIWIYCLKDLMLDLDLITYKFCHSVTSLSSLLECISYQENY